MTADPVTLALFSTVAVLLFESIGGSIWRRKRGRATQSQRIIRLRRNLLAKTFGNEYTVDSLIEFERRKSGHSPLEELMQAAIDRWEHDNR